MQEQFPAGACQCTIPKNEALAISAIRRKCRTHFSAGAWQRTIPKNEELLLSIAPAHRYPRAIFGGCVSTHYPQNEMHTENAGPFSGACASAHGPENEALRLWQKMQIALFSA
jgi:hypothetical protein